MNVIDEEGEDLAPSRPMSPVEQMNLISLTENKRSTEAQDYTESDLEVRNVCCSYQRCSNVRHMHDVKPKCFFTKRTTAS